MKSHHFDKYPSTIHIKSITLAYTCLLSTPSHYNCYALTHIAELAIGMFSIGDCKLYY